MLSLPTFCNHETNQEPYGRETTIFSKKKKISKKKIKKNVMSHWTTLLHKKKKVMVLYIHVETRDL